jgi:thiol-disulfide isomerase/thioredoxin
MKNSILLFLCLAAVSTSLFAQKTFVITGQLSGVKDGAEITLMKDYGTVLSQAAKDSVVNGRFRIEYDPQNENVEKYSISCYGNGFPSLGLKLWAKAGHTIQIKGENHLVYTWKVISDIPEQKEWAYFVNENRDLWNKFQQLSIKRSSLIRERNADEKSTNEEKEKANRVIDSIDQLSDSCQYEIYKNNLALLEKSTITPVRLEILRGIANLIKWNNKEEFRSPVKKIYDRLDANLMNSPDGEMVGLILYPPHIAKIGEPMYDTLLTDLNGNSYHLADFKGKYILLDFWSFGCGPCHASVPEMKEISEAFKDKLAVVSLTSDSKEMWKKASDYFKMTWNNLSDLKENRGIYAKYGVTGIPNYVLISPDGIIKDSWTGYGKGSLKTKIKELTGLTVN